MKVSSFLTAVFANVCIWVAPPVRADEAAAIAALREAGFKVKQAADATEIGFGQPEWTPELWPRLGEITSLNALHCKQAKCAHPTRVLNRRERMQRRKGGWPPFPLFPPVQ